MKRIATLCLALLLPACGSQSSSGQGESEPRAQPDRWVETVGTQSDTKVEYVGKTTPVLSSTTVKALPDVRGIAVGNTINGVRVGAIKCTFFPHDSSYGGEQFMWRGRWGCIAGRNQAEVDNAVRDDGTKAFDYIHLAPTTL